MVRMDTEEGYKLYCQAYSWDKKRQCFRGKMEDSELLELFQKNYALYKDDQYIGYGSISFPLSSHHSKSGSKSDNSVTLSYIIHPNYRKSGYGEKLVNNLIKEASDKGEFVKVVILKKNIASISLIEKLNFEFESFDKNTITFQKRIKK